VAAGIPREIARAKSSRTASYLAKYLGKPEKSGKTNTWARNVNR